MQIRIKRCSWKHCASVAAGVDDKNASSNVIFTIKDTKLYVLAVTLPVKDTDYQKVYKKSVKDICRNE